MSEIMRLCGRLEEAAAALRYAIAVQRTARVEKPCPYPHIWLAIVYVEMGQFQRAVEIGLEGEPLVEAQKGSRSALAGVAHILWATLANAYEGLGRMDRCWNYHRRAFDDGLWRGRSSAEGMTCFGRMARAFDYLGWD